MLRFHGFLLCLLPILPAGLLALGQGSYDAGPGKTYATIQAALNQLYVDQGTAPFTQTQTIWVWGGSYTGQSFINAGLQPTSNYRLVITAAPGTTPIVTASSNEQAFELSVPNVTVNGFRLSGFSDSGIHGINTSGLIVSNNESSGSTIAGLRFYNCVGTVVYGNYCHDNYGSGIEVLLGSAVVYGNHTHTNGTFDEGINVFQASVLVYNNLLRNERAGVRFTNPPGGQIYNNSFDNCAYGMTFGQASTGGRCKNNLVSRSSIAAISISNDSTTGFISDFNNLSPSAGNTVIFGGTSYATLGAWQAGQLKDLNSISAADGFTTPGGATADSYKVLAGAAAVGAGVDLSSTFSGDYFGNIRNLPWDIGFHAFAGFSPTPTPSASATFTISPTFSHTTSRTPSPTQSETWTVTPSFTATPSRTPTRSASPTFTATATFSPSPSATLTPTPTTTASHTFSPTVTSTGSFSPTATVTLSGTISPTFSVSPNYPRSGLGRLALAPVPALAGEQVCLYFDAQPLSSEWELFNPAGEKVGAAAFQGAQHCIATRGFAAGLYHAKIKVTYTGGDTRSTFIKLVVLKGP